MILERISTKEKELCHEKQDFLGEKTLKEQPINSPHEPKKYSQKSICICSDVELRVIFLTWYLEQQKIAREIRLAARITGSQAGLPAGFFTSGGHILCNLTSLPLEFQT